MRTSGEKVGGGAPEPESSPTSGGNGNPAPDASGTRRRKLPAVAAAGLLAIVVLAGCGVQRRGMPPRPPRNAEVPEPEKIFRVLDVRRARVHALRARARVKLHFPQLSRRVRPFIVAERPDRLRWEIVSPFGTMFVLAAREGMIAAYDPGEKKVYRGGASAQNLARFTGVDVPVTLAVDILLGTPPLLHRGALNVVSRDAVGLKLWQSAGAGSSVYWFDGLLNPIRYELRDDQGYVRLRARYAEFVERAGVRLPERLAVEIPPGRSVELELGELEVNPVLSDDLFELRTPPGAEEINLDRVMP